MTKSEEEKQKHAEWHREWRKKNPEKAHGSPEWRKLHPEKAREIDRRKREFYREKRLEYARKYNKPYYEKNRSVIREKQSDYYKENAEVIKGKVSEYYKRNEINIKEKRKTSRMELMAWMQGIKQQLNCCKCPENHPSCLEFHHLDPETKEYAVGRMFSLSLSSEKLKQMILEEMGKCIVLCSNCHKKEHHKTIGCP